MPLKAPTPPGYSMRVGGCPLGTGRAYPQRTQGSVSHSGPNPSEVGSCLTPGVGRSEKTALQISS